METRNRKKGVLLSRGVSRVVLKKVLGEKGVRDAVDQNGMWQQMICVY